MSAASDVYKRQSMLDPDHNQMSIHWMQFRKSESDLILPITEEHVRMLSFVIPKNAKKNQVAYVVATVKDDGLIPLTTYKIVEITIQ